MGGIKLSEVSSLELATLIQLHGSRSQGILKRVRRCPHFMTTSLRTMNIDSLLDLVNRFKDGTEGDRDFNVIIEFK